MYILQDGKLYVQDGDVLVGVNVTPTGTTKINTEKTKFGNSYSLLTPFEVRAKFNIASGESYMFPVKKVEEPKVEVAKDDTVGKAKNPTRKPATRRKSTS